MTFIQFSVCIGIMAFFVLTFSIGVQIWRAVEGTRQDYLHIHNELVRLNNWIFEVDERSRK